jgi:hypothetical protein
MSKICDWNVAEGEATEKSDERFGDFFQSFRYVFKTKQHTCLAHRDLAKLFY